MKRTIFILLIIAIVGWISSVLSVAFDNKIEIKPSDKSNIILVSVPVQNSEISSPLIVAGRARGSWFFEASFPILLLDQNGNVIAESHASAQGPWQTDEFVSFIGNIYFNNYIKGTKGTLVVKKDNPTGLPEFDDSISIPVILK